ncbi:MAG: EAL domain-containing protein [Burkholderiaceae bacterium]|nr:EAL domain-containing protein [Burkholderiaceae bacterium]
MSQPHSPSTEPTAGSAAANPALRLAPGALLAFARDLATRRRRGMLLQVSLNRSDRLSALAQEPRARLVLAEVMRRVESILRPGDRYALASMDECWVMLVDLPGEALAELASRTLRDSLTRQMHIESDEGPVIVQMRPAIGGAWRHPDAGQDPMAVLAAAADACQRAVQLEERILILPAQSDVELVNRGMLERDLRMALHANELDVHFQPQVSLASGRCTGAEALVRWTRPDGTTVSPSLIASICEERGLMTQLTQFVLNTALRNLMTWSAQGIDAHVSINLSAVTLADPAFPTLVGHALSTWGIPADRLTLELTESAVVKHERSALQFMREIREHGCGLALDDFGTGYSSFAYLRQYPLTELKIDQSFVRNLHADASDRRIVNALVDLAHTFDMQALAEGVEDAPTARMLHELGCDLAQGYHYGRAMAAPDFANWWRGFSVVPAETESVATP